MFVNIVGPRGKKAGVRLVLKYSGLFEDDPAGVLCFSSGDPRKEIADCSQIHYFRLVKGIAIEGKRKRGCRSSGAFCTGM
jgi:hypothetical protein